VKSIKQKDYIRIAVCVFMGALLIGTGANGLNDGNILTQPYSLALTAFGLFIIMYGFNPKIGNAIVKAITKIVTVSLKRLFK
jgi:hypothetical protein